MYNTSYSNILLLKNQKEDVSFVANKKTMEECNFHIKNDENPLKIIKRVKTAEGIQFITDEVYDISQTDAVKRQEKPYSKEYIETMLKGMCSRRGISFYPNDPMLNLENIIYNIKDNSRADSSNKYNNVEEYAKQIQVESDATKFAVAKNLNISTKNYNLKDICKWGIEKGDLPTLKESLKYIQKFTNYFMKDFRTQEKLNNMENEKQEEEELE